MVDVKDSHHVADIKIESVIQRKTSEANPSNKWNLPTIVANIKTPVK